MRATVQWRKDLVTPAMDRALKAVANRQPVLESMGHALVSYTTRSFSDSSLRVSPWPPNRPGFGGTTRAGSQLRRSGALWQSIRISALSAASVTVGTDRPYAIYQQLGTRPYVIRPKTKRALWWRGLAHPVGAVNHPGLPPRPFFPFTSNGEMGPRAVTQVRAAAEEKLRHHGVTWS